MQQLPQEQVQKTAQVMLAFLDSPGANVPGNLLEGVVSGKSLLRGLLAGSLAIVSTAPAAQPQATLAPAAPPEGEKKPSKKAA